MGDHNHLFKTVRVSVSISILVLAVIVLAFGAKEGDDTFLFLSTNYEPPPSCPPNEFYKTCLGNCSDCENRGICDFEGCKNKGCDCIMNFVRLTPGGPCEPVHHCPVPDECDENEVFRECGPICEWCSIMRCRVLQCEHRCYCKEGYLRDSEGKCIPQENCPPKMICSRDEERAESGPVDEYCLHADGEEVSNATETREKCYCKEGFKRNSMGHCVEETHCEYVQCLNGEVYQKCPKKCNTTCRNYGDTTCKEDGQCYPGCFCPDGYLMNDYRQCVKLEDCPPGSNPFAPTAGPTTTPAMTESTTPAGTETPTALSQETTEEQETSEETDASESTLIPTTASPSESTVVEETTETVVVEDPVTSTTETADQSSTTEESEDETPATTQKPKALRIPNRKEKEKKATPKEKKATTPVEDDMEDEN